VNHAPTASWAALMEEDADDLYENAPCGFVSTLLDGTIVKVNATFARWTGARPEELVGKRRFQSLLSPGSRLLHEVQITPLLLLQGMVREISLELSCGDDARLPVLVNSVVKYDGTGHPLLVRTTVVDATERAAYERELRRARDREREARTLAEQLQQQLAERNEQLERLAYTDTLTGVDNRRALEAHLARTISRAQRGHVGLGVALIDVDRFKHINDGFGHEAGDTVLAAIARRAVVAVRLEDVVGRWGGEEFLCVALDAGPAGMPALCERIRDSVRATPVEHGRSLIPVSVSVGWATWRSGESADALLARADRALYEAKRSGRDAVRGARDPDAGSPPALH
jgi:diguanylate cyclase (GGDEF)-like protein/PAS domain S-box-containing protein